MLSEAGDCLTLFAFMGKTAAGINVADRWSGLANAGQTLPINAGRPISVVVVKKMCQTNGPIANEFRSYGRSCQELLITCARVSGNLSLSAQCSKFFSENGVQYIPLGTVGQAATQTDARNDGMRQATTTRPSSVRSATSNLAVITSNAIEK